MRLSVQRAEVRCAFGDRDHIWDVEAPLPAASAGEAQFWCQGGHLHEVLSGVAS